jgi:16S rRNA (guanine(1405)-N(7))-methyltransferase
MLNKENVVAELLRTRKYGQTTVETLERVAEWALARHAAPGDALKAAKRKMHQVCGAYFNAAHLRPLERIVSALPPPEDTGAFLSACRRAMEYHASTKERLPILEQLYERLLAMVPRPRSIVDIGCGLNPFSLPWLLRLFPAGGLDYHACDIDRRLIVLVNSFMRHMGLPEQGIVQDILGQPLDLPLPEEPDIVFLFKILPCLEQQEKGVGLRLVRDLPGKTVIVSFPGKSLGGKNKGMQGHYGAFLDQLLSGLAAAARTVEFPSETFFIVTRKGS